MAGAWVDVGEFDTCLARGDPVSLERAVSLYTGPLLEGCPEAWALPERAAREQAYLAALSPFWLGRDYWREARKWLEAALEQDAPQAPQDAAAPGRTPQRLQTLQIERARARALGALGCLTDQQFDESALPRARVEGAC
jgi:hypothetical protein